MKFKIEQVALCPPDPERAIALLKKLGMEDWVHDIVVAHGVVNAGMEARIPGYPFITNVARLAFNYSGLQDAKELEVLHYDAGENWMAQHSPSVSHLGMHCSLHELNEWKSFFKREQIGIVQEVKTQSHSNPAIAGKRWYHYCIFNTRPILGVDLKFIVRKEQA